MASASSSRNTTDAGTSASPEADADGSFDFDPSYCHGAVSKKKKLVVASNSSLTNRDDHTTTKRYVVFYPRAGMGNVMMGYVSAAMYACLTGRDLKIAPPNNRETGVFKCNAYFASEEGSICDGLEMDDDLVTKYESSGTPIRSPEAWSLEHCTNNQQHLQHFMCDDGLGAEEFVAISSCQFYGDLFYNNLYFKERLSSDTFRKIVRARARPSSEVKKRMGEDGPYQVCVHVRWDNVQTSSNLGKDWVDSLEICVNNLLATGVQDDASREILLFTMHENVRKAVKDTLEKHGNHRVRFASETDPRGGAGGHSNDAYQGIADMFSLGKKCINLLPSKPDSTYFLLGANLMGEGIRVFPGNIWKESACLPGSEVTEMNPTGDFWNNNDVCSIRGTTCDV